jgi:hypothetical protein
MARFVGLDVCCGHPVATRARATWPRPAVAGLVVNPGPILRCSPMIYVMPLPRRAKPYI